LSLGVLLPGCATFPVFPGLADGWKEPAGSAPRERWALVSDPHISWDPDDAVGPVNMADQLRTAVSDLLERSATSSPGEVPMDGVIVNGDCALEFGRPGDYATFAKLLVDPVCRAGLPLHLTLGNHDRRQHFRCALSEYTGPQGNDGRAVDGRIVSIIHGRCANFFLLDTLDERHILAGGVGQRQIDWLAAALERFNDRPAIVVGHHPLDAEAGLFGQNISLLDNALLWKALTRFPHVKAYIFGHTHRWDVQKRDGIYLVNLPTTAYTFDAGQPKGWVEMWLDAQGARLQLHHIAKAPMACADSAVLRWA
jgi:3',5'-cyclic AMP phosphodiesterase CpdA